jgi:3-oxoacyl-[acyl-carrier-protein] synthase III
LPADGIELIGLGHRIPTQRPTGVDATSYRGWSVYCVAGDDDHPSTMGAAALEAALAAAGIPGSELDLVLFTGVSRDYQPSWSVATEIAGRVGATCAGVDLTLGCLGLLIGLELARGWTTDARWHNVAVISAERWTHTIDRTDPGSVGLWGHSDGAAAIVASTAPGRRGFARFRGSSYLSAPDGNGHILVRYGGTRHPVPPPGTSPFMRTVRPVDRKLMSDKYIAALEHVIRDVAAHFAVPIERIICNQVAPHFVDRVETTFGLPARSIPRTGERVGHVGGADIVLALDELVRAGVKGPVIAASTCAYCWAAGVLELG